MKNIMALKKRGFLTESQVLIAYKFSKNPNAYHLAPSLYRVLHDIIINEEPLEALEKRMGWPGRSAKALLRILLYSLQEIGGTHLEVDTAQALQEKLAHVCGEEWLKIMPLMQEFDLTPLEAQIMLILQASPEGRASKSAIHNRLYLHEQDAPELKIVDVFICKLRNKIKGRGWQINTLWGIGYQIIKTDKPPP